MVWAGAFSLGLGREQLWLHFTWGRKRKTATTGRESSWFVSFPPVCVPVLVPWALYKVHAPYHDSHHHIFSAPTETLSPAWNTAPTCKQAFPPAGLPCPKR